MSETYPILAMANRSSVTKIGIVANSVHARNIYKILERWVNMQVTGIYEVDFVELYGLKKYKKMICESPDEVIQNADVLIVHSNDLGFNDKVIQSAFERQISVITGPLLLGYK